MVGDGPERPKAEWLANLHGVAGDVQFLGKQSDMTRVLSIADILLLPSELESFGLVALEAMACEVPVVATRVGGIPEVVRDGVDGFLHAVGDVASMAEGCLRLLEDPSLQRTMGESARNRAGHEFSAGQIVQKYEDLYRRTIAAAKSSR
jgi:N-acetyl-alpha-D-glucosaminyl L-malate synthase BshA